MINDLRTEVAEKAEAHIRESGAELFRGMHKKYLGGYVAMLEFTINLKRIRPTFISSLVATHSLRT